MLGLMMGITWLLIMDDVNIDAEDNAEDDAEDAMDGDEEVEEGRS